MLPLFDPPPPADRLDAALLRKEGERLARNLPPALLAALCSWHREPSPASSADLRAAIGLHAPALHARLAATRKDISL